MTSNAFTRIWLPVLLLVALLGSFSCKSGGGTNDNNDNLGLRPSITGLSRTSANIGDQVFINGLNFGDSQSSSSVRLNGLDFTVNSWTDGQIDATVVSGMTSGIVVVTRGSLQSLSGAEAQLYIPSAPQGQPLINALNPDYGRIGTDQIQVLGFNFGSTQGTSKVLFTGQAALLAAGVSQADNLVEASVVTIDVGGTPVPQWTNSSVKVWVPATAASGPVYVEVNGVRSNGIGFTAQPPPTTGAPDIVTVTPLNGPVGTTITIDGANFGHVQGGSTLTIGSPGVALGVAAWANAQIIATIPAGAQSGRIRITVGGDFDESEQFIVANKPLITGVSPSEIRIGQPLTIFGQNFGASRGTGSLKVGSSIVSVADANWTDGRIDVPVLPSINASDPQNVPVIVTADNTLASDPFMVSITSDLTASLYVTPSAGQRNGSAGEPGTTFAFNVSVFGGVGPYKYTLIPNADHPDVVAPEASASPVLYTYPYDAAAADEMTIDTQMKIVDSSNGDTIIVNGPTVKVVNFGVPVITAIELGNYNRAAVAPNDWCYSFADNSYNVFTFLGDTTYFTTTKTQIIDQGNPVPSTSRNEAQFLSGGTLPRPYGHRYKGTTGSEVVVKGLNFGSAQGTLSLNSSDVANQTPVTTFTSWTDTGNAAEIRFNIPQDVTKNLSGTITVTPSGGAKSAVSVDKLICSAYVSSVLPSPVALDGDLVLQGFDLTAPAVPNISGTQTYLIWAVRAEYTDPFTSSTATGLVLCANPFPVTPAGTSITFDMGQLSGTLPYVEVLNGTNTQGQVVQATNLINNQTYYCFLWTGALTAGTDIMRANSGVFSEALAIQIGASGGNQQPNANLVANPSSGPSPLDVELDASGSSDPDGSIVNYTFDPGDGSGPVDNGNNPLLNHTYAADGIYTAQVTVTDNGTPGLTDSATTTVNAGGAGTTHTVTGKVLVLTQDWPLGQPPTTAPLAGIVVSAFATDNTTLLGTSAPSDASGNFTIPNVTEQPGGLWVRIIEPQAGLIEIIAPASGDHSFFVIPFDADRNVGNFIDSGGFSVG